MLATQIYSNVAVGRSAGHYQSLSGDTSFMALRNFFWGKKETLAQDIVGSAISTLFSGILVAAAATIILDSLERRIVLSERRRAVESLINENLTESIEEISNSYDGIACVHNVGLIGTPECEDSLRQLANLTRGRSQLLLSLGVTELEPSTVLFLGSIQALIRVDEESSDMTIRSRAQQALNDRYLELIGGMANEFQ